MATYATLTIDAADIIGADFDASRCSAWIEANTPDGLIVVDAEHVRLGGRRENPDATGIITFGNLVTTNSADNPTSFGYRVTIVYVPKGSRKQGHDTITTSDFPLTGNANLANIPEAWDNVTIPAMWRSAFRDQMDTLRAETQAARDEAVDISGIETTADAVKVIIKPRDILNILDYGVTTGTTSTQTVAIKAALDANPGKAFYFPPGDYRLDTQLNVTANNSLRIDGRIYAGATMGTLINWDNGQASAANYAQDKFIDGSGVIDGNLLADTALAVGSVIRFPIEGLTIKDPIKRGLVTKALGAEVFARNLRFHNTGTTNVADNIAIEANMGDCHFMHIVVRDFTTGIWDKNGNRWIDVHPWLGDATQIAARYPTSVGFLLAKNSRLISPYVDTYRYGFRGTGTYDTVVIMTPEFLTNPGNLSDAIGSANPGAVFDLGATGHRFIVSDGTYNGRSAAAPVALTAGTTRRFFHTNGVIRNDVTGGGDYAWGVKLGTSTFSPTIEGSTGTGAHAYTTQEGHLEIRGLSSASSRGMALYHFRVAATLGSGTTGNLRVGGLPYPTGASAIRSGIGNVARVTGGVHATGFISSSQAPAGPPWTGTALQAIHQTSAAGATSEVSAPAAGTVVEYWGTLEVPLVISTS